MEANEHNPFLRALETGGPWVADLLRALDSSSRSALAQSSKAGLKMLLEEWPNTAVLDILVKGSDAEVPAPRPKALRSARAQLLARGSLPTQLALAQEDSREMSQDDAWWERVLPELKWAGLRALALQFQHIPAALLMCAGQAFQHLTTLRLAGLGTTIDTAQLPSPTALPALRVLTIGSVAGASQAAMLFSVAPYMRQLTSLTMDHQFGAERTEAGHPLWSTLFTPSNPTHTLTHLDVRHILQPWLAGLLRVAAPQLQELTCDASGRWDSRPSSPLPACSWTRLNVRHSRSRGLNMTYMHWVPSPADSKLVLVPMYCGERAVQLDLWNDDVAGMLSRLDFSACAELRLAANRVHAVGQTIEDEAAALHDAVASLAATVQPSQVRLVLLEFTMSPALAAEMSAVYEAGWHKMSYYNWFDRWPKHLNLTTTLPPLRTLEFVIARLDDNRCAQLRQSLSSLDTLIVMSPKLQSPLPADAVVPWRVLRVAGPIGVSSWVKQVELLGDTVIWELSYMEICLTVDKVDSCEAARMAEVVKMARVRQAKEYEYAAVHKCSGMSTADEARVLQASLAIANQLPGTEHMTDWSDPKPHDDWFEKWDIETSKRQA